MSHATSALARVDPAALSDVASDYCCASETNLLARWSGYAGWQSHRANAGLDHEGAMAMTPAGPTLDAMNSLGIRQAGLNFAARDPLNLATHPAVMAAAAQAMAETGLHAAGPVTAMGLSPSVVALEQAVASFLHASNVTVFPSGWAAGYGTVRALLAEHDHAVIDAASHDCLQAGARAAGAQLHRTLHLSMEAVHSRLRAIRATDAKGGILVATETQFAVNAGVPDLAALQSLCRAYAASFAVLTTQDLGCLGAGGHGQLELQQMLGQVDIVIGSFAKSFAANGGFAAAREPGLKHALRHGASTLGASNAMAPHQAAAILAALAVICSPEGAVRRARLLRNILHLRERCSSAGFRVLGEPSATLPIHLGDTAQSRLATRFAWDQGVFVTLAEHPVVPRRTCRWLCQMMSGHTPAQIDRFAEITIAARKKAANWLSAHALASADADPAAA